MKTTKIAFIFVSLAILAACSATKKTVAPVSAAPPPTPPPSFNFVLVKPADGIHAPGDEELTAIQKQYQDVTLQQLRAGHTIYTKGACTNCHDAKNIYQIGEEHWKDILDDMAPKARISDLEKDAVNKYVLSIKATQPK